ncbi:MAG: carbonic anhydrase family protein [Kofleriaceae bacterium]
MSLKKSVHALAMLPLFLLACTDGNGAAGVTQQAVGPVVQCMNNQPVAPPDPEWSYHDPETSYEVWGTLPGYETCELGTQQSPINIEDAATVTSSQGLVFVGYNRQRIPLDLTDNGHTLQINYIRSAQTPLDDPRIIYNGQTYYLVQMHWHSTSEHTVNGDTTAPFEVHLVHRSATGALAVVGILYDLGAEDPILASALANAPEHLNRHTCTSFIDLSTIIPADRTVYHYDGSLTTPTCAEGVNWFVMGARRTASAEQEGLFQERFHGVTNRPVQPLNGRIVTKYVP